MGYSHRSVRDGHVEAVEDDFRIFVLAIILVAAADFHGIHGSLFYLHFSLARGELVETSRLVSNFFVAALQFVFGSMDGLQLVMLSSWPFH
jgi:hypothetical protein